MSVTKNAQNAAMISLAAGIEYTTGFFASVLIARSLGPTLFGSYAFLVWFVGLLVTFSVLGVPIACIKFVGRLVGSSQEAQLSALVKWLRNFTLILGLGVFVTYAFSAQFIPTQELPFNIWFTTSFVIICATLRAAYRFNLSVAQARERYELGAIAQCIGSISYVAMIGTLLLFEVNLLYYLAAYFITSLVQFVVIAVRMPNSIGLVEQTANLSDDLRRDVKRNLFYGSQFVFVSCFSWGAIEFFLLKKYSSLESVAYFSVALTLAKASSELLTGGFASTLAPVVAKLIAPESKEGLNKVLSESVGFFALLATIISCLSLVAVPGIVSLFYGAKYDAVLPYISAMMLFTGLNTIYSPLAVYQTVNDHESERMRLGLAMALINIVLSIIIIPRFGLPGAVFCFVANLFLYSACGYWLMRKRIQLRIGFKYFFKLFASASVAVAVSAPIALLPFKLAFVPAGIICMLVLFGVSIVFGTFPLYYFQSASKLYKKLFRGSASVDAFLTRLGSRFSRPLDH